MEIPGFTPEVLDESYKQHAVVSDTIEQIVGQMQELMKSLVSYQSTTHTALLCCDKFKKVLRDHRDLRKKLPSDASSWNAEVHEEMILTWKTSVEHCSDMADIVDGMKQCIRKELPSITDVLDRMKALNEALPICNVQATAKPFCDATACHKTYAGSVDLVKDIIADSGKRHKPKASGNVSDYFQHESKKKAGVGMMGTVDQRLAASHQNDVQELSDSDDEAEMQFSPSHDKQSQNKEADERHGNHNPSADKLRKRHMPSEKIEEDIADSEDEASLGTATVKNIRAGQASSSSSGSKKRSKPAESPDTEHLQSSLLSDMTAEEGKHLHKKANMQAEDLPIAPSHRKQYGTAEQKHTLLVEALSPHHKELPGNNVKAMHQAQQALPAVAPLAHLDEQQPAADSGQEMRRKSPRGKSPAASLNMDSNSDNDSSYHEHPEGARKLPPQSATKKQVHPASLMKGNPSPPQSSATRDPVAAIKGKSSGQVHQPPQLDMVPKKDRKDRHRGEEVVDLT